jgi:ribosomal protein L40E
MDSCSGLLRVSPYFYNTIEENAIAEILGSRRNKRRTVMLCPNCNAGCSPDDQYCRRCGTDLTVPSTSLVPAQSSLPAILQPQLPRLAAGVGAVAVGVGVELLRRSLLARMTRASRNSRLLPASPIDGLKDILRPEGDKPVKLPKGYEIHETVVYLRRVIRRED